MLLLWEQIVIQLLQTHLNWICMIGATITTGTNHGFVVGDTVQYVANSTALTGLTDKAVYKVASINGTAQFTLTKTDGSTLTYGGGNGHANDSFKLYNVNSSGVIPSKTIFPSSTLVHIMLVFLCLAVRVVA